MWVGKDLLRSANLLPQLNHGQLQHLAWNMSSWMVNISTEDDFFTSLHSLPYCSEDIFSHVHLEFPTFHFVPVASCPVTRQHSE